MVIKMVMALQLSEGALYNKVLIQLLGAMVVGVDKFLQGIVLGRNV